MGTILEAYESKHGKREDSLNPLQWDQGLSNFEDGWLAGFTFWTIWQSLNNGNVDADKRTHIYTSDEYKEQLNIIDTLKKEASENEFS
jgi:hypothetical protein